MWKSFVLELHGAWSEFAAGYKAFRHPRQPYGANGLTVRTSPNQIAPASPLSTPEYLQPPFSAQ
jgi:hypothetical protein